MVTETPAQQSLPRRLFGRLRAFPRRQAVTSVDHQVEMASKPVSMRQHDEADAFKPLGRGRVGRIIRVCRIHGVAR
jgi:hypothetical protein